MQRAAVVVQSDEVSVMTAPLALAAVGRGITVHDVSLRHPRPFTADSDGPFLIYGSVAMLHDWAPQQAILRPWIWWNEQGLSPDTWTRRLDNMYLNADGHATTAGNIPDGWYARPMLNTKAFTGGLDHRDVPDGTPVWTAPPKALAAEARVFVVHGAPVAASTYQLNGEHYRRVDGQHATDALCFAATVADRWLPLPHCVIDVALTDGEWKVIELNSINTSAWYAVDPGCVLDAYFAA